MIMNVPEITNQQAWSLFTSRKGETRPDSSGPAAREAKQAEKADTTDDEEKSKGVLALLQEGHFQGVADVRLRINFHDELQQLAAQNATETFSSGAAALSEQVVERVRQLADAYGSPDGLDTYAQTFAKAVGDATAAQESGSSEMDASLDAVRKAFASLMESLQGVLASNPAPKTEDTFDGTTTIDTDLNILSTWFNEHMDMLSGDATDSGSLPPLSTARGNGAAYAKFVEIYNSLNGETEVPAADDGDDSLDVQA